MRRAPLALVFAIVLFAGPTRGTQGTCTITSSMTTTSLNLAFPMPVVNGLVMPVEFDGASGTFSMQRDAWSAQFGSGGAQFDIPFGDNLHGFIVMSPGTVSGTIDAAGNVTLPGFAMAFATDFCPPRSPDYPIMPDLATGVQFRFVTGQPFALEGVPLDFTTGTLTLEGQDTIPGACGAPGALLAGLRLTCTLAPIPDRAQLPPAPSLAKLDGKAKIGKPLPSTPPKKPDKGDVLTLKTRLADWRTPLDLANEDVYTRVEDGSGNPIVLLRVPAGKFATKGKRSQVRDTDGSAIQVLTGHKQNDAVSAAFGGTITLVTGGNGTVLKLRVQGLDLASLSGSASLTIAMGPHSATAAVSVAGSGKSRRLH
jgi:hypothetical protein